MKTEGRRKLDRLTRLPKFPMLLLLTVLAFIAVTASLALHVTGSLADAEPSARPAAAATTTHTQARHADLLIETIGVNTHLRYTDTVYYTRFDDVILPRLKQLGVRYVRERALTAEQHGPDHYFYTRLHELAQLGIRFSLVTDFEHSRRPETRWSALTDINEWLDGAVWAFEGPNEPDRIVDLPPDEWIHRTRDAQQKLWSTVNSSPGLAEVKVLGPPLTTWRNQWASLGDLSPYLHYGNWHPYPGAAKPSMQGGKHMLVDRQLGPQLVSGNKPLVVSETGYTNAINKGEAGHRPASELATASYIPKLLFEYFNRGYARTFLYEFIDLKPDPTFTKQERHFGLLRNDGTPKPAFEALQRLIELLADPGPPFTATPLAFTLLGEAEGVETSLLQKRDGTYYLALWQDVSVWDSTTRVDVVHPPKRLVLQLPKAATTMHVFQPNRDGLPTDTRHQADALPLSLGNDLLIVQVRP